MQTLTELINDADPIRHETPWPEAERETVRAALFAGIPGVADIPPMRSRVRFVAAIAATVIGTATLGYEVWEHSTPLAAAVRFEIRLAEDSPFPGARVARLAHSDLLLYLHPEIVIGNDDVLDAWVAPNGELFDVTVALAPAAVERMRQATAAHVGHRVAIVIDDQVVLAPVVRSPIAESALITGNYSKADAERIAAGIR